jgi:hypothetical protein
LASALDISVQNGYQVNTFTRTRVVALDLEGTLISNAVSQIPRPGLYQFLEFCRGTFERIVIFTAVSEPLTRRIVDQLVLDGDAPPWFAADLEYVNWTGSYKDLGFIPGAILEETLLLDDQEDYVLPEQKQFWIRVPEFDPRRLPGDDAFTALEALLRGRAVPASCGPLPSEPAIDYPV